MNKLADLLSSRVKAEIFRLLFGGPRQELHVREIARQSDLSEATVRQELKRLARLELVAARRDGNRTCFRANTEHPLYPDIRNIALKTSGLVYVLHEVLAKERKAIRVAYVFGSIASGSDKAQSDVDLMVIGDLSLRQLGRLLSGVSLELGREINAHVVDEGEFAKRRKSHDHFLTTVLAAPKLFVIGNENELTRLG